MFSSHSRPAWEVTSKIEGKALKPSGKSLPGSKEDFLGYQDKNKKEGSDHESKFGYPKRNLARSASISYETETSTYLSRIGSKSPLVEKISHNLFKLARKLSSLLVEDCSVQVKWIAEDLSFLRRALNYIGSREDTDPDDMHLMEYIMFFVLDAENVVDSVTIKPYKRRQKGDDYLVVKSTVDLEWILYRMGKTIEKVKSYLVRKSIVMAETAPPLRRRVDTTMVARALEKLDHILSRNLITREDVIEIVLRVRDGYLSEVRSIFPSEFNSTWNWSRRSKTVWLEEVNDICYYTVDVAKKFIERRERVRNVWHVFYSFEQHVMEMNLMKQMEDINTQLGDTLYRRRTFGDGEKVVMGDMLGSRSKPVTSFSLVVFPWRSLDQNLNTTQRYLTMMRAFFIDRAVEGLDHRQKVWVEQLRVVARKGRLLVDSYPEEYGFRFLLTRIIFARDINYLLDEIIDISDRKEIYGIANIEGRRKESLSSVPSIQRTESEIIVQVERDEDDSITEETPLVQPDSFSYRHITEFEQEFQFIKGEQQLMDALFHDVQEIGYDKLDERSQIWVHQMKEIASEIALVIEECGRELKHKSMLNSVFESKAQFYTMDKIKRIRKKLKDSSRSRKAYGLVQRQSRAESFYRRTQLMPLIVKNSRMVGFDEDVEFLVAQLLSDEKHRCITSIFGTGGTGKTKLAKFIFGTKAVVDHFDFVIWVSLRSVHNMEQLKNRIAKKAKRIMGGQYDRMTTAAVLATLASKRYLIVFDDVETLDVLDTLRETVPDMSTASRVLLTTRSAMIAQRAATRSSFVHPLRLLDDENSWILFTTNFNVEIHSKPKLQEVGKKIVAKCGGLPLEILKMNKLLSRKGVTEENWREVLEQPKKGQNPWSETLVTFDTILPRYLRRCLFYFELFPADFEIPVRRLVVLWVAEGLVHLGGDQEEPPELVAERYLTGLIDLNMVQIAKRKLNGKVKTCRLPNGLREILFIDSRIPQVSTSTDFDAVPINSIRRVADHLEERDTWHKHIHGRDYDSLSTYYQNVFSFLSFDTRPGSKPGQEIGNFLNLCIHSNCLLLLRVLDLEGVYKPNLPKDIAKLSRLKYLGLRWTYLESLPSSISGLLQLQTLDLKHTYINTLTSSIWRTKLRHLFLSESNRTRFPPKPIGLNTSNSLSDLQTLWGIFVDEETHVKGGLDKLVNITKLGITCQSKSSQQEEMEPQLDAVADWILKLEYLQSLRLKSRDKQGRPWKIHLKLLQHTNLTDLYLLGSLSTPLNQLFLPPTLVVLTLSHSKLAEDPMQLLKDLPNLRSLSLLAESYLGKTFVCPSESFYQLFFFKVWKLEQLEEWKIEQKALPSLRQLEIRLCPRMKVLPDGLKYLNSLLELKLTNMSMEISTDKNNIPPNCKVHRDDSSQYEEQQFVYTALSRRKPHIEGKLVSSRSLKKVTS